MCREEVLIRIDIPDDPEATVFDSGRHWAVMDGGKGGIPTIAEVLPHANAFLCSRHLAENVKERAGGKAAGAMYHRALNCKTDAQLQDFEAKFALDKFNTYMQRQLVKHKEGKLQVFPAWR